ncbi:MAG: pseudouridine synthase [Myxococcota bacterium]
MTRFDLLDCRHSPLCGGCPLSDVSYPEQLAQKSRKLEAALRAYPAFRELALPPTEAAEPHAGYRLRAKLVADGRALGLFARGSHDVLDIPDCRVMSAPVAAAVAEVRAALPFDFPLLGLDVREVDRGALVTLVVAPDVARRKLELVAQELLRTEAPIVGVSFSRRRPRAPQVLGSAPEHLAGVAHAEHHFAPDLPFHFATPGGFVQAHAGQTAKLHRRVTEVLASELHGLEGRRVLELYAGAGALALSLARAGANVIAADSYAPSLSQARAAAEQQGLKLRVIEASAEDVIATESGVDAVIVDPPRKGLSTAVRRALAAHRPRIVIYVSCEPRTLARDLAHLAELGLVARSVQPWDMIPQSEAVEALAVLTPQKPNAPRVLFQDERLLAVEKPAYLPTTPQGEYGHSLLDAVRALDGASRAVPVHRLDLGTSGVCLFARAPDAVPALSEALARGQKRYLALVQGITHKQGRIERAINDGTGVRDALTHYERQRVVGTHSLVCASPKTGRRHQIRRHFAGIGHPLLGDTRYGNPAANRHFEERHGLDRPFLHLERIELVLDGQSVTLVSELAPELAAVLTSLAETEPRRSIETKKAAPRRE